MQNEKRFRHEIFGFVLGFTRVFCPGTRLHSRLERHQLYFEGSQAPKRTPVAPGLLLFLGAQSSLWGAYFSLGGAQADEIVAGNSNKTKIQAETSTKLRRRPFLLDYSWM